ncbi:hypothetical protein EKE94_02395 [Mesobaculum littorinae]|uniref:DoxX family protein n=1 Tax=Mesobaculum littorinae TaxID=2486419 RepID=A0A438AL49_9RHOB|nr:hypothetical protein [Mesobaculum littorinae]RVV99553.1 hypothetical protein EKE94_02395 [Mesobaculum littorinae]
MLYLSSRLRGAVRIGASFLIMSEAADAVVLPEITADAMTTYGAPLHADLSTATLVLHGILVLSGLLLLLNRRPRVAAGISAAIYAGATVVAPDFGGDTARGLGLAILALCTLFLMSWTDPRGNPRRRGFL